MGARHPFLPHPALGKAGRSRWRGGCCAALEGGVTGNAYVSQELSCCSKPVIQLLPLRC